MLNLAPRQGIFAIFVVVSFFIHVAAFIFTTEHRQNAQYQAVAEQSAEQLSQELKGPLSVSDRVSVSVIVERQLQEHEIAFIGVYDTDDKLLVPVGDETADTTQVKRAIVSGNSALGSVVVKLSPVNKAEIVVANWLFIAIILVMHTMLLLALYAIGLPQAYDDKTADANQKLSQHQEGFVSDIEDNTGKVSDGVDDDGDDDAVPQDTNTPKASCMKVDSSKVDLDKPAYVVQVLFADPQGLLNTLVTQKRESHFALCDQVLQKTMEHLLALPVLKGVQAVKIEPFDERGSHVILQGEQGAKPALAAVMLAKVMLMINQTMYKYGCQADVFMLPIRTTASDLQHAESVCMVAAKRKETPLVMIDKAEHAKQMPFLKFSLLGLPNSVYERQCYELQSTNEGTAVRLSEICKKVLKA